MSYCTVCVREEVFGRDLDSVLRQRPLNAFELQCARWHVGNVACGVAVVLPDEQLRCNCKRVAGLSSSEIIVREKYRQFVFDKFGERLTLALLFALPSECVAWENTTLVKVASDSGELIVSDKGVVLLDAMRTFDVTGYMSTLRTTPMRLSELIDGYSYLFLLKTEYRGACALKYGRDVSLLHLFQDIPSTYWNWDNLATMSFTSVDGRVVVTPFVEGAPFYQSAAVALVREVSSVGRVWADTILPKNATCVAFMPDQDMNSRRSYDAKMRTMHVKLNDGVSFIPTGSVVVAAATKLLLFETGYDIVTQSGNRIRGEVNPIAVFVDGSVGFSVVPSEYSGTVKDYDIVHTGKARNYKVGVHVTSYVEGTVLSEWFKDRFDKTSSSAKFAAVAAELVVLSYQIDLTCVNVSGLMKEVADDTDGTINSTAYRFEGDPVLTGIFDIDKRDAVVASAQALVYPSIGGVVDAASSVYVVGPLYLSFVDEKGKVGSMRQADVSILQIADCEAVDEWYQEHTASLDFRTSDKFDAALDVLDMYEDFCSGAKIVPADPGNYLALAKHPTALARLVGLRPTLADVIFAPADLFDLDKFKITGLSFSDDDDRSQQSDVDNFDDWYKVAYSDWDFSWKCLAKYNRRVWPKFKDTLGSWLVKTYQDVDSSDDEHGMFVWPEDRVLNFL